MSELTGPMMRRLVELDDAGGSVRCFQWRQSRKVIPRLLALGLIRKTVRTVEIEHYEITPLGLATIYPEIAEPLQPVDFDVPVTRKEGK